MDEVYQKVYKKYPEVAGKKPVSRLQADGNKLLIFKGFVETANGFKLPRIVRVLIDENGKILKMTTSK
jgi:hypothetical protein